MRAKKLSIALKAASAIISVALLVTNAWAAPREKALHNFKGKGGTVPYAGLIFDAAGNLYGTTAGGGAHHYGTVFELTPNAGGGWTEKVLHSFTGGDGEGPSAGVIFDQAGNLYGTTTDGGTGFGTVFELTSNSDGTWTESVLYSFTGGQFGLGWPSAGLIFDAHGNLYGTAQGGAYGWGAVFELTSNSNGTWTESVLYSFCSLTKCQDGLLPMAGLIFDQVGNLYGTTSGGGAANSGTVFELTPNSDGTWAESVLYSFAGQYDGSEPFAGLIFDAAGNLYGTTYAGGIHVHGTVFELTPTASGGWTEKILYPFNNNGRDGHYPYAGVIFDASGNLYGTTRSGGTHNYGTAFELTPKASGRWTRTVLHDFKPKVKDGLSPYAGLILDSSGNLYGTTQYGGTHNRGTVFKITP